MNVYKQRLILSKSEFDIKAISDLLIEWECEINYIIDNDIFIINFDDREKLDYFYDLLCSIKDNLFLLNTCYNL